MRPDARAWFDTRTTSAPDLAAIDVAGLLRAKRRGGHRVSVVLPARDEEATVGRLVADLPAWVREVPLVDELVVVDSDSTDATAAVARGRRRRRRRDRRRAARGTARRPGKGEALWKSLAVTTGDLVVFLDADLLGDVSHYVPGLLGPAAHRSARAATSRAATPGRSRSTAPAGRPAAAGSPS